MNAPAIRVQRIGKRYKIGLREQARTTLGEVLLGTLTAPLRRLRALREKPQGEDIFWALRDVSFEVQPGEVVGIIGRNGAGKSTLLKILSRITEPTEGRAEIRGRVRSLLEVGTGFHPELTGRENIYLNGALLGMKKAEIKRKFDEITAFAEVDRFLDTPVKRYSSGMYVRLAFAVAAHLEPEILLIDEVLAVGDASFQKRCLGKMRDVAGHGRTIIFVSHNMSAVSQLCTRAIHLSDGKVVEQGEPEAVIERYLASTSLRAQMPIRERVDRTGSGQLKFTGVRLLVDGRDVTCVRSGQDVTVEMTYEAARPLQPLDARLAFSFSTVTNIRLIAFDTAASQLPLRHFPERSTLRCRIPRFPLLRGRYKLTLFAEINGTCADRLEDALHFEVLGGQYPTVGWFATEHEWDSIHN